MLDHLCCKLLGGKIPASFIYGYSVEKAGSDEFGIVKNQIHYSLLTPEERKKVDDDITGLLKNSLMEHVAKLLNSNNVNDINRAVQLYERVSDSWQYRALKKRQEHLAENKQK